MHNNYYFLKQLTPNLDSNIRDAVISECFSQSKNELIIRFETREGSFFIKGSLQPDFSCLNFIKEFNRARKNSVDLFEPIIGQKVTTLKQYENERSFSIQLTENWLLLFKMHGNKSNIILFQKEEVHDLFRKKLISDLRIDLKSLNRQVDWSYENFVRHENAPEKIYFTFGKNIWRYLYENGFNKKSTREKWDLIQQLLNRLNEKKYFITNVGGALILSLVEFGEVRKVFTDPIDAINYFFSTYNSHDAFTREKSKAISGLTSQLTGSLRYVEKTREKLNQIAADDHYKIWADLIMANLHLIQPGSAAVQLPDFYHENRVTEVKLKKDLSPQKNAEVYYRKAKNHSIELDHLQRTLSAKQEEIKNLESTLDEVSQAEDLKTLRQLTKSSDRLIERDVSASPLPYHEFMHNGYRIWVGKNAASNDELTLKYSFKEDLWLHAKDVAGSHVIIKYQAGKKFPKDVIERGAQLAAYNSKRKNETLCPVIVTPKKFVRKRKGDPPGAVVVEREEVIMVEPAK